MSPRHHQLHCTLGAKTAQQCGLWLCCTLAHCAPLTGSMLGEASAETAAETAAGTHWADIYVSTYLQYLDTVCLHLTLPRPIYKHGGDTRSSRRFPRFSSVPLIIQIYRECLCINGVSLLKVPHCTKSPPLVTRALFNNSAWHCSTSHWHCNLTSSSLSRPLQSIAAV